MSQKVELFFSAKRDIYGEQRTHIQDGNQIAVLEDGRRFRITAHPDGGIQVNGDDQLAIILNASNHISIRFAEEPA